MYSLRGLMSPFSLMALVGPRTLLHLETKQSTSPNLTSGWYGLETFAMCDIGVAMMMEVMVEDLSFLLWNPGMEYLGVEYSISCKLISKVGSWVVADHFSNIVYFKWLREWFSQTDQRQPVPRIPMMANMNSGSPLPRKDRISQESNAYPGRSDNHIDAPNKNIAVIDEHFENDEELQIDEPEDAEWFDSDVRMTDKDDEDTNEIDLSCFFGNLRRDDHANGHDCWSVPDGSNFTIRGKSYLTDKSKISAGKYLMELVAVDWFKDMKRMDHVARRQGCAVQVASEKGLFSIVINLQVPGSTHYSMVLYFVMKRLVSGSLLQRFVDGDDEFRNSRLKLIPCVRKGTWLVRQSVGSTPCLLGKALDCSYIRGSNYLEIDVDIGSSTVAKGVLGLVCGAITSLVVDIAFLVQANTQDELPERVIGAIRGSYIQLSSAVIPEMDDSQSGSAILDHLFFFCPVASKLKEQGKPTCRIKANIPMKLR
ncbi:Protein ENHANCED DISEASE RESISTANCE 2 [Asimina triloba]